MKGKWLGICTVLALVVGIIVYKQAGESEAGTSGVGMPEGEAPQVLLFADPHEADEVGGCGEIFRLVRRVASEGIPVLEVDPRGGNALIREYQVVVEPTLIVLDERDQEAARFEGEDATTISAMESALQRLPGVHR